MKNILRFFGLFAIVFMLFANTVRAQKDGVVTGFLIKMTEVKQLTEQGANAIKIFAAQSPTGDNWYVLVGLNANGAVMNKKIIVNDGTGDCPPTCDFMPSKLSAGVVIEEAEAAGYVANYKQSYPSAYNAVIICAESIDKVAEKFNYMKVIISGQVIISGVKDDGGTSTADTFSKDCNQMMKSAL